MRILVLTASINAQLAKPIYTSLMDTDIRLEQYMTTLRKYIEESHFNIFIFCENTGYEFPREELTKLASKYSKVVEYLSFVANIEAVGLQGKGYGEGECIEYAVNNSQYLKEETACFYKITGRLFIKNINQIIRETKNKENCFFTRGLKSNFVETVFFKSGVAFFKENLSLIYTQSNDFQSIFLEHVYFNELKNHKIDAISPYPYIIGNSGTTGKPYIEKNEYKSKILFNMLGYYKVNRTFYRRKNTIKKMLSYLKIWQ